MNNPTCWQCGTPGHTQRECPYMAPPDNSNGFRPPPGNSNVNVFPPSRGWKGKGKPFGKMPGKGAYEVRQEEYFADFDGQDQEEAPDIGFGGGDIDAIGVERPWTQVVRKARSPTDMRPMRWKLKKRVGDNVCCDNVVCSVERDRPQTIGAVQQLIEGWERIAMKVDSGAIDIVMPPHTATRFAVRATDQSVNGSRVPPGQRRDD